MLEQVEDIFCFWVGEKDLIRFIYTLRQCSNYSPFISELQHPARVDDTLKETRNGLKHNHGTHKKSPKYLIISEGETRGVKRQPPVHSFFAKRTKEDVTHVKERPMGIVVFSATIDRDRGEKICLEVEHIRWDQPISTCKKIKQYGYKYDYVSRRLVEGADPIPKWLMEICEELVSSNKMKRMPDQVEILLMEPKDTTPKQVDAINVFDDQVHCLAVNSGFEVGLEFGSEKNPISLWSRSIVALSNTSRSKWSRRIVKRKGCGIVITFRKVKDSWLEGNVKRQC